MALRQRLISGFAMAGALLLAVFLLPGGAEPLVLLPLAALAMIEFYAMLDASRIPQFKVVGTLCGLGLILATWLAGRGYLPGGKEVEPSILYVIFAICFLRQLFHKGTESAWSTTAGTLLGIAYVAFLMNFMGKLLTEWGQAQGRFLLLLLAVSVKLTDVGAYFTGCAIGRHKLIPRISPKKTWEGCIGGVLTGIGAALFLTHLMQGRAGITVFSTTATVVIAFLLAVFGILGDLIESLFKRAAGVKDSGRMILGMGGILDVLDSLLFAAPVLYIAARVLLS
jgi:phosphatidate cytidylyltransferase